MGSLTHERLLQRRRRDQVGRSLGLGSRAIASARASAALRVAVHLCGMYDMARVREDAEVVGPLARGAATFRFSASQFLVGWSQFRSRLPACRNARSGRRGLDAIRLGYGLPSSRWSPT